MNLQEIRNAYINDGLNYELAIARACQDVIISLIANSRMADCITVKGGVVMQQISKDKRRATRDLDLDFVRYPMTDEGIKAFIKSLAPTDMNIKLKIVGEIEELKHQDYSGKRVHLLIVDSQGTKMETKLDLGVHNLLELAQDELFFDTALQDGGVSLMANSKEQICAEKLRSLLRIGVASTRFKDVFDVYYLLCREGVNLDAFNHAMSLLIYNDSSMRENNAADVRVRLNQVLNNKRFQRNLANAKNNWLGANIDKVISGILRYFE